MINRREALRVLGLAGAASFARARPSAGQGFVPDVDLRLTAAPDEVALLPGAPTRVRRFTARLISGPARTLDVPPGGYLGPIIRLRRGQRVRIRFDNQLGEDSIVHWHGLDVPAAADGHPRLAIGHGREYVYEFEVTNRAGTYWYHPHPHMRTGPQVYSGLAGLLLVSDAEEDALGLPSAGAELLAVLQDRRFDARNQFVYGDGMMEMMNGVLGDRVLVNGVLAPTVDVDAGWQRVRLLNGSNARIYKLAWSRDLPMTVIGGDGGLLERPVAQRVLTLAPAQRADLLINLTGITPGTAIELNSLPYPLADAGRVGMMAPVAVPNGAALRVMTLRTRARAGARFDMPRHLSAYGPAWSVSRNAAVRRVPLRFQRMQWTLGDRLFEMDGVAPEETVTAGSTHVWEFANQTNPMGMEMAHPIHLHGPQFRVLGREGGRPTNALREGIVEAGWTDTVLVLPGETVRTQVTFSEHRGLYLYHCHILEHEDMGMMRNFRVT